MRIQFLLLALVCSACTTAQAQQPKPVQWDTEAGRVTYSLEDGPFGVLDYPAPFGDNVGYFYINGLAGEFGGPGPLEGWWSEPDVSHDDEDDNTLICPFVIVDNHGRTTRNWGRLVITFAQDDFPSDFTILRGRCFEDPKDVLRGKLVR
jgi:hypothetical protein